jgi:hypothetical protein
MKFASIRNLWIAVTYPSLDASSDSSFEARRLDWRRGAANFNIDCTMKEDEFDDLLFSEQFEKYFDFLGTLKGGMPLKCFTKLLYGIWHELEDDFPTEEKVEEMELEEFLDGDWKFIDV